MVFELAWRTTSGHPNTNWRVTTQNWSNKPSPLLVSTTDRSRPRLKQDSGWVWHRLNMSARAASLKVGACGKTLCGSEVSLAAGVKEKETPSSRYTPSPAAARKFRALTSQVQAPRALQPV